jgi:hypothetical protein
MGRTDEMAQPRRISRHPLLAFAMSFAMLMFAPPAGAATEGAEQAQIHEQASVSPPSPVQAVPADDVVESIGVNTHIGYSNTNYDEFPMVRQRLQELGIRYIRDHISQNRPDVYSRMRTLAADGIHLNVIAGDPLQRWNIGTIDQQLDLIQQELLASVISIEGPNEYDLQGDPNWVPVLRDYTQRLWEGVKARPALAGLPVIGPSIVRRGNMAAVGDLTGWIDYGNTHTYLSGAMPETASVWSGELSAAAENSGTKPVQVTETGYHNGVNGTVGHQPASEKASGIYMPRLFLENFRRGTTSRSFSYELMDQRDDPSKTDIEAAFGLLRNDFSKKPAATAIERLIGLLSDRGPRFTPDSLSYSLEGAPSTARQLLLQKRDGSFYLVLWNRVSVWDQSDRADTNPADVAVTVKLGQPIASAEIFEPNVAGAAIATAADPTEIELDLSERVTVVRLVPPGVAPAPTPSPDPEPQQPAPDPEPAPVDPEPEPTPDPAPSPDPVPSPEPAPAEDPAPAPAPAPNPNPAPAPDPTPAPKPVPVPVPKPTPVPIPLPPRAASVAVPDSQQAAGPPAPAGATAPSPTAASGPQSAASGPVQRSHRPRKKARKHRRGGRGAHPIKRAGSRGYGHSD